MDLTAIVKELVEEREMLDRAIQSLERIAQHRGKRRGRPPAWMTVLEKEPKEPKAKKRGRPRRNSSGSR